MGKSCHVVGIRPEGLCGTDARVLWQDDDDLADLEGASCRGPRRHWLALSPAVPEAGGHHLVADSAGQPAYVRRNPGHVAKVYEHQRPWLQPGGLSREIR